MLNGNSNYYDNCNCITDLNELFEKTLEFDIIKCVLQGILRNQQNYENKLIELKLENLKNQKEISLLNEEMAKKLQNKENEEKRDNKNPRQLEDKAIINYRQKNESVDSNFEKLIEDKKRINSYNKKIENIKRQNYEGNMNRNYNSQINLNEEKEYFNKNINDEINIKNEENYKKINISNQIINKNNDDENMNKPENKKNNKNIENSINKLNNSSLNISDNFHNENLLSIQYEKNNYSKNYFNKDLNYKNRVNSSKIESEFKFLTKISDIEKNFNEFKKFTNATLSSINQSIGEIISNKIMVIEQEFENNIKSLNENIIKKINSLNILINDLTQLNQSNENLMNSTKSQNSTIISKMEIINSKFIEQISKTEFEKYKNTIYEKMENGNKGINIDLSLIKKDITEIKSKILEITNDQADDHKDLEKLLQKQETTNLFINKFQDFQKDYLEKEKRRFNLDPSKIVDIEKFNDFQKNQNRINEKKKKEIIDINRDLNDIKNFGLVDKASFKDLKNLEDEILSKIEELISTIKEKFLEKKYLQKYTKLIESKTKQSLEEFKSNLKPGINWLMAKKPFGYLCASCEAYLGDINANNTEKFIPWNKYSSKEIAENKFNKVNGGFSKIIQMMNNYDTEKNNSTTFIKKIQQQNINFSNENKKKNGENEEQINLNNKKTTSNSAHFSNIYGNASKSMVNNSSNNISINNFDNNSFQIEEYENDMNNSLPKIKKKTFSASNISSLEANLFQKHSFSLAKGKDGNNYLNGNDDVIIMTKEDQDKSKRKIELGSPKITKILKKVNKKRDNIRTLNNELNHIIDNK